MCVKMSGWKMSSKAENIVEELPWHLEWLWVSGYSTLATLTIVAQLNRTTESRSSARMCTTLHCHHALLHCRARRRAAVGAAPVLEPARPQQLLHKICILSRVNAGNRSSSASTSAQLLLAAPPPPSPSAAGVVTSRLLEALIHVKIRSRAAAERLPVWSHVGC